MMKPTIHMNGTPRDRLHEAYMHAYEQVGRALAAVRETGPNGRDYYPQGQDAITDAIREHVARLKVLEQILADYEALCLHTMRTE